MNHILQNMKSGFANMKELFGIFLSNDDNNEDGYDIYINSEDLDVSKTAQELKEIEQEQETKRLSLFNSFAIKKTTKKKLKSVDISNTASSSSPKTISNDVFIEGAEPEK